MEEAHIMSSLTYVMMCLNIYLTKWCPFKIWNKSGLSSRPLSTYPMFSNPQIFLPQSILNFVNWQILQPKNHNDRKRASKSDSLAHSPRHTMHTFNHLLVAGERAGPRCAIRSPLFSVRARAALKTPARKHLFRPTCFSNHQITSAKASSSHFYLSLSVFDDFAKNFLSVKNFNMRSSS